jgi:hypothetical protein
MIKNWEEFNSVDLRKNYIGLSTDDIWSIFLELKEEMDKQLNISIEYGNMYYNERTKEYKYSSTELRSVFTNQKCINIIFEVNADIPITLSTSFHKYMKITTNRLSSMGYNFFLYDTGTNKYSVNNIATKNIISYRYLISKKD